MYHDSQKLTVCWFSVYLFLCSNFSCFNQIIAVLRGTSAQSLLKRASVTTAHRPFTCEHFVHMWDATITGKMRAEDSEKITFICMWSISSYQNWWLHKQKNFFFQKKNDFTSRCQWELNNGFANNKKAIVQIELRFPDR